LFPSIADLCNQSWREPLPADAPQTLWKRP
jgi:hypothetical protein